MSQVFRRILCSDALKFLGDDGAEFLGEFRRKVTSCLLLVFRDMMLRNFVVRLSKMR